MDVLDSIFKKYSNRNIIMNWSDKEFSGLLDDLYDYFQNEDDVTEFMATEADEYLSKYGIDLVEPEEFEMDVDFDSIPGRVSDVRPTDAEMPHRAPKDINYYNEIKRMQELAGLWEEDEDDDEEEMEDEGPEESDSEIVSQDYMLTFNTPEDRDQAVMYFKDPNNHPKEIQKHTRGRLQMRPEDAVSIIFPTMENRKSCGLDERKLKGIVEIMHRVINKKFPNSKTMKMETK
jgi:hypothetical protein